MSLPSLDPSTEYTQRLERSRAQRAIAEQTSRRIGNGRLLVALAAALVAWLVWGERTLPALWLLLPVAAFVALAAWHQGVLRRRRFADRALRYYEEGLRRLRDEWPGTGATGEAFCPAEHVYADDLDVFGSGSLFQLLSRARTAFGEATLARWLLGPAERDEVLQRQTAVQELAPLLQLREDIALLASEASASIHAEALRGWAAEPALALPGSARWLALGLAIAGTVSAVACLAGRLPLSVFLLVFIGDVLFLILLRKPLAAAAAMVELPAADLDLLSVLISRLEAERFTSPRLRAVSNALTVEGAHASTRIAHLRRWVEILDSSDHFFVRVLNPILLWRPQVIMAIEHWRQRNGSYVARWLEAVGDFEALSSLAGLYFERPAWTFPNLEAENSGARFAAEGLCHPLLPRARAVANDVALGHGTDLLIISGSNMSGKSTLLRAVGLSAVLAWSGAPVAAQKLQLSALQVGASLRVTDSLQDNRSRFMAEITRLRNIVALTDGNIPVLFLFDELLSGTNSHDRRIGAAAIVKSLLASGAIGLLTTHDLALSAIESELNGRGRNAHFQDTITDGTIRFDYRLHTGVVTHSNALELMRAVGLPV